MPGETGGRTQIHRAGAACGLPAVLGDCPAPVRRPAEQGGITMAGHRVGRGLFVALAGLGMLVAGSGVAHARTATVVLSDKISYSGTAIGSSPGTWTFSASTCKEISIGETVLYPCQLNGAFLANSAGGIGGGYLTLTSADGLIQWKFTLTPSSLGPNIYNMKGVGMERETEAGVTVSNPASMRGVVKLVPSGPNLLVTGVTTVWELSTAP